MFKRLRTRLLPLIFLLLLLPCLVPGQKGEITVKDYCHLSQSLLELSLKEWEERADLATAHKGDRQKLNRELEEVTRRYRPLREEVYSRHGMSRTEDLRYASQHQSEIKSYLDENPEVKDYLESLKTRINVLIERFESATQPPAEGANK